MILSEVREKVKMILNETQTQTCERTWRSSEPVRTDDKDIYRQHRCGLPDGHLDACVCRYDGTPLHTIGGR